MKKLFLLLAFTGIVGATSATSIVTLAKGTVITLGGEEKKGDEKKKKCDKEKSCCKSKETAANGKACSGEKTTEAKTCSKDGKAEGKACCKGKTEAKATTAAPAVK